MYNLINIHANQRCPTLCENCEYHIRTPTSGANYVEVENKTTLFVFYASPKVKIEEEYVLMGGNAIISATGGSLGLFLGLSCYGVAWTIVEKLESAYNFVLSSWRKRRAKFRTLNEDSPC